MFGDLMHREKCQCYEEATIQSSLVTTEIIKSKQAEIERKFKIFKMWMLTMSFINVAVLVCVCQLAIGMPHETYKPEALPDNNMPQPHNNVNPVTYTDNDSPDNESPHHHRLDTPLEINVQSSTDQKILQEHMIETEDVSKLENDKNMKLHDVSQMKADDELVWTVSENLKDISKSDQKSIINQDEEPAAENQPIISRDTKEDDSLTDSLCEKDPGGQCLPIIPSLAKEENENASNFSVLCEMIVAFTVYIQSILLSFSTCVALIDHVSENLDIYIACLGLLTFTCGFLYILHYDYHKEAPKAHKIFLKDKYVAADSKPNGNLMETSQYEEIINPAF